MKRIAFLFLPLLSGPMLHAQEDTLDLTPVEVRAIRAGSTAPFTKTNLTRAGIEKENLGQDLPFVLNRTPSVVVNSDAGNGVGYTGIRIRGTDATRINVTLNGVPFNDAESGGSFFVNLPDFTSSAASIQIQRGVGTSSNGPGAFGATINLSTNEVAKKSYVELANSFGSFNTLKNTLRAGTGLLAGKFTVDARLSRISSDGYVDRARSDLKAFYVSGAYLGQKSSLRLNVFGGSEETYQAWNGISADDLKTNRTYNSAGTERPGEPYDDETDNYNQTHYQLFFDHKISPSLVFNTGVFYVKGKGYYQQYKADRKYADYNITSPEAGITRTDLVRQLWLDNDFYGTIFSLQHQSPGMQLTFGGSVSNYVGSHFGTVIWADKGFTGNGRWYDNDADKNDWNVYGKWQQQLAPSLQLFTDLQLRRIGYRADGFRDYPTLSVDESYTFFNPKAGLSYTKNNIMAYASYSVANKEPNRDDFEVGASQLPKPEQLHDIELGVEGKGSRFNWGATLYYMNYKDQLVLTGKINDVGAYTRTNIAKSYRAGIELQAGMNLATWARLDANLALSRNRIKDFTEYIDQYDEDYNFVGQQANFYGETDISFSPDAVGGATLTLKPTQPLEISLLGKYVGSQYLDNTSNDARKLRAYYTQDLRAIYSFAFKKIKNISLIAQVANVFNTLYEPNGYTFSYYYVGALATENYYYPMAGTNWMAGITIKL
ncbi:MAG: TonB-dependent receptor [Chitinophagaceae bacterium]